MTDEQSAGANDKLPPFQRRTQPSSPEDASSVLVMFQLTRHTWELWLSNWATICTSNLEGPVDVLSFLSGGSEKQCTDTEVGPHFCHFKRAAATQVHPLKICRSNMYEMHCTWIHWDVKCMMSMTTLISVHYESVTWEHWQYRERNISHLMGTSLKILTSLVAMASTWKDLPRFGANAMSWTASVTVISVSALAYFLFNSGLKIQLNNY